MTIRIFSCCALLSIATLIVRAADDKPATPTLAQALGTNVVGTHTFSPAWTGQCAVVHATGVFTRAEPLVMATNRYRLKFDTVVVTPKETAGNVGRRGLARAEKDGGYSALHAQRDSLPKDEKLKAAATTGDLVKLLGIPQGFGERTTLGTEPRNRVSWRYFALKDKGSLETLEVSALTEVRGRSAQRQAQIDSIEILRGTAAIEIKTPEKKDKKSDDEKKSEEKKDEKKD